MVIDRTEGDRADRRIQLQMFGRLDQITYFDRANLYTLSSYMQIDLADEERRKAWLVHVQAMVADLVGRRK